MVYDKTIEMIKAQNEDLRNLGLNALAWIAFSPGPPMPAIALQQALAVEIGTSKLDKDNMTNIEVIISACAGLVISVGSALALVHETTQQYLRDTEDAWLQDPRTLISQSYLTFLTFDEFGYRDCDFNRINSTGFHLHPLDRWLRWYFHSYSKLYTNNDETLALAKKFLLDENLYSHSFIERRKKNIYTKPNTDSPLFIAIEVGLDLLIPKLVPMGGVNIPFAAGSWPIHNLTKETNHRILQLLVSCPDVDDVSSGELGRWAGDLLDSDLETGFIRRRLSSPSKG